MHAIHPSEWAETKGCIYRRSLLPLTLGTIVGVWCPYTVHTVMAGDGDSMVDMDSTGE